MIGLSTGLIGAASYGFTDSGTVDWRRFAQGAAVGFAAGFVEGYATAFVSAALACGVIPSMAAAFIGGSLGNMTLQAGGIATGLQTTPFSMRDVLIAGATSAGTAGVLAKFLGACFGAGTKLLTPEGLKAIEDIEPGDMVLARSEYDVKRPVEAKLVEETFKRVGRVFNLHVSGKVIRTSGEHPFYVDGKGWIEACRLEAGDLLASLDGQWTAVEELVDTGEYETLLPRQL